MTRTCVSLVTLTLTVIVIVLVTVIVIVIVIVRIPRNPPCGRKRTLLEWRRC